MDGLLVVDKPVGPTSHDVVMRVRRALGERRIGHTGTLDPAASGVLALVLGRATRLARFMSGDRKQYDAIVRLGWATDTYDAEGKPAGTAHQGVWPSAAILDAVLQGFRGTFMQRPPAYSAKKIGGRRSYDIARRQEALEEPLPVLAPVMVAVDELTVTGYEDGILRLTVSCSAGFYVRSLAHDLGEQLGTGAHLAGLRRTRSGLATLDQARTLAAIEDDPRSAVDAMVPMASVLPSMPAAVLTSAGARRAVHGCSLGPADLVGGSIGEVVDHPAAREAPADDASLRRIDAAPAAQVSAVRHVRLLSLDGNLLGVAEITTGSGLLHPCIVLM